MDYAIARHNEGRTHDSASSLKSIFIEGRQYNKSVMEKGSILDVHTKLLRANAADPSTFLCLFVHHTLLLHLGDQESQVSNERVTFNCSRLKSILYWIF